MNEQDLVARLISPSVSLAGLLLVFIGFLLTRARAVDSLRLSRPLRGLAWWGLCAVASALLCAGLCVAALAWNWSAAAIPWMFIGTLVAAVIYAFVALSRI